MDWKRQATKEQMEDFINTSPNCVKVLAANNLDYNSGTAKCEGVFVYRLDGDQDNGVGFLLSNIISIDFPAKRGDIVQYRTVISSQKPYITQVLDGSGN